MRDCFYRQTTADLHIRELAMAMYVRFWAAMLTCGYLFTARFVGRQGDTKSAHPEGCALFAVFPRRRSAGRKSACIKGLRV